MTDPKPDLKAVTDEGPAQGVIGAPDGTVLLRIGTDEWRLRRPTFREYREAVEASDKAIKGGSLPTAKPGEATLTDPIAHSYLTWAPGRFAFWRTIVSVLGDRPFPDDDDLPMWLASGDPINDLMGHWLSTPPAAPGG